MPLEPRHRPLPRLLLRAAEREPGSGHVVARRRGTGDDPSPRDDLATLREELSRAREDLARARADLARGGKLSALGQLAAGVAHEINTPVQFIGDNLVFLRAAFDALLAAAKAGAGDGGTVQGPPRANRMPLDYLTVQVPRALEQSVDGVNRVAAIVSGLRQFAHPGGEDFALTDIRGMCDVVAQVSRHEWKYVAELAVEVEPGHVACFRDRVVQVLLNLIVNAAHAIEAGGLASGERGRITLRGRPLPGGGCTLEVEDNGCGMEPGTLSRVFDPFFTTKPSGKGSGQGLAIARGIVVEAHGGSIHAASVPGVGTTFTLFLPGRDCRPPTGLS